MGKRIYRVIIIINLCIFLFGCNSINNAIIQGKTNSSITEGYDEINTYIPLNIEGLHTFIAYYKNSIIYHMIDNSSVFYRYHIDTNIKEELGTIPNYYLSGKHTTMIDNQLYFYASVSNPDENVLFSIDLQNNKLNKIFSNNNHFALIPLDRFDDNLVSLRDDLEEPKKLITSELVVYNPRTKQETRMLYNELDPFAQNRESVINFSCDDEKYYLIIQKAIDDNIENTIGVYDRNFEQLNSLTINKLSNIVNGYVADFKVFGSYVFINSASNHSAIARMVSNQIEVIYEGDNIDMAINHTNSKQRYYIFFKRDANEYLILDSDTNKLYEATYYFQNYYVNRCLLADSENIIFVLYDGENESNQSIYQLNLSEFINQNIPKDSEYLSN